MVSRVRVARAHLGHVRDPQDEADKAHSQGHQLLFLQVGQDFWPKLIFDERDGHFHVAKLGNQRRKKFNFSFIVIAVILSCFLPLKLAEERWSGNFRLGCLCWRPPHDKKTLSPGHSPLSSCR